MLSLASFATAETINFDSLSNGTTGTTLNNYLAGYGITVSGLTSGTYLEAADDRLVYEGGYVEASSPHIYLTQGGISSAISYTLNFQTPLSSLAFTRITVKGGPNSGNGTIYPEWSFQVFEGSSQIASGGQGYYSLWNPNIDAAQTYSFTGQGITSVRFSGNGYGEAAFCSALIDDIVTQPVPEPSTFALLGMGVAGMAFFGWRRRQK